MKWKEGGGTLRGLSIISTVGLQEWVRQRLVGQFIHWSRWKIMEFLLLMLYSAALYETSDTSLEKTMIRCKTTIRCKATIGCKSTMRCETTISWAGFLLITMTVPVNILVGVKYGWKFKPIVCHILETYTVIFSFYVYVWPRHSTSFTGFMVLLDQ